MNSCLLCATPIRLRLSFSDIFLSRQTQQVICQSCFMQFEYISDRHCEVCYKPDISGVCQDCKQFKNPVMHHAIFHYNDFAKTYFKQYKFNGDFRLRAAFNQILRGEKVARIQRTIGKREERIAAKYGTRETRTGKIA